MDGDTGTLTGVDQAALAKIPPALQSVIDAGDLSGFVTLIWRGGQELQFTALGKRDIASGAPMQRDTLFRIASMTKPVTSIAALMLMEEEQAQASRSDHQVAARVREHAGAEGRARDRSRTPIRRARWPSPSNPDDHRSGTAYGFTSIGPIAYAYQKALGDVLTNDMGRRTHG